MKIDKSLQEVWDWKDKIYQENKYLSLKETVDKIRRETHEISEKYNLRLKKLQLAQR